MENKKEPSISVIVPVFNTARFLEECIVSIINQSFDDLQIILVDDGSTDGSGQICDRFAEKDERITVIHQSNAGVSAARNVGLREAKGKYIVFADCDDSLPQDAYENLIKEVKENYLSMGRIRLMSEDGTLQNSLSFGEKEISKDTFLKDLFLENKFPYLGYPTDKLFQMELIKKYGLSFDESIKLNEDRLFVLAYALHCKGVIFSEHIIYNYRQRESGVIQSTRRNATVTDSEMTVLDSFRKMRNICRDYSDELYYICSRKAFESALDLLNRVSKEDKNKRKLLRIFLLENSRICLSNPQYTIVDRIKIIGHTLLKK